MQRLRCIREAHVDEVLRGIVVVALIGLPASLVRALNTGWLHLYTFHIVLAGLVVALYLGRQRLTMNIKVAGIIGLFWAVGIAGVATLGLLGAGIWWLVVSALLMSTFYSIRAGLITIAAVLLVIAIAGTGFVTGWLLLQVDAHEYVRAATSWITVTVAMALMPVIVFRAVSSMHATTLTLLREVEEQRLLIEKLATHDELTGLPTRSLAIDRLEQAMRAQRRTAGQVAVLFIDLDGFKAVNDRYGHIAGDEVLKATASRIRATLREDDTIARVGGDEFLVVLARVASEDRPLELVQQLQQAIGEPISRGGAMLSVQASIGMSVFPGDASTAATTAADLIHAADVAMYTIKRARQNLTRSAAEIAQTGPSAAALPIKPCPIPEQGKATLSQIGKFE